MKYTSLFAAFLIGAAAASAQHLSVGIKVGTPLTDLVSDQTFTSVDVVTRTFSDSTRIIIGPMLEVRLPLGLAIEADALYRPVGVTFQTQVIPRTSVQSSQSASSWQFPVLGKFRIPFPIVHPYVEAGPSFRHVGGLFNAYWSDKGLTIGGGAEVKILKLRIAPELRYTRWGSDPRTARNLVPLSDQNQAEFLVGFSF